MATFEITDYELSGAKTVIKAKGVAEAMHEYLPWSSMHLLVTLHTGHKIYEVTDKQTDFRYDVMEIDNG